MPMDNPAGKREGNWFSTVIRFDLLSLSCFRLRTMDNDIMQKSHLSSDWKRMAFLLIQVNVIKLGGL